MKTKYISNISYLLLFIVFLLNSVSSEAQSTYGQAKLKCKECLLLQVLREADTQYKEGNYNEAVPYYNLYLKASGDNNPVVMEKLADSYWQNRAYGDAAEMYNKLQTPKALERLAIVASLKNEPVQPPSNLKFFERDGLGNDKPADNLLVKQDNSNYRVTISCAKQYRAEMCGTSILINSDLPNEKPNEIKPPPKEEAEVTVNHKNIASPSYIIHFDFDSYRIEQQAYLTMDSVIHDLETDARLGVVLVGHTDLMGTELYNEKLAFNRSEMAETYIMSGGINAKRIIAKAFGKRIPLYPIQEPMRANRRVEIYFIQYGE